MKRSTNKETKPNKENKRLWRFWKSNLPAIIWDKDGECALADFLINEPKYTFTTDDERIAKVLQQKGYPEIALDADGPPDIVFDLGHSLEEGENIPVIGGKAQPPQPIR